MTKMKILKGAGFSADTLRLVVEKSNAVIFDKKYYCGYDYSWSRDWATKEKPFEQDLIDSIKEKYNATEIEYGEGERLLP